MTIQWNDEENQHLNPATGNEFADPPPGYVYRGGSSHPKPEDRLREVDLTTYDEDAEQDAVGGRPHWGAEPQLAAAAEVNRQTQYAAALRRALGHLEAAYQWAPASTPEGVQIRELAARVDNLATDAERRAQS